MPPRAASRPGTTGRPPLKGVRLPSLAERLRDPRTCWRRVVIDGWYGHRARRLDSVTGTALWHHPGMRVAIRWVLVRDPSGEKDPQGFLCTDLTAEPTDILHWFVRRWRTETTFEEARRHLGVESQRQWSDLAVLRTTQAAPRLVLPRRALGQQPRCRAQDPARAGEWYAKPRPTFSDALAMIRAELWTAQVSALSPNAGNARNLPTDLLDRLLLVVCRPP